MCERGSSRRRQCAHVCEALFPGSAARAACPARKGGRRLSFVSVRRAFEWLPSSSRLKAGACLWESRVSVHQ